MKCLVIQPIHETGIALLRNSGVEPVLCPARDMATVARYIKDCDAAITRDAGLNAEAFAAGERLRVVVVHGTGHDPVDKEAAARAGVVIANTPGANARSVAELGSWPLGFGRAPHPCGRPYGARRRNRVSRIRQFHRTVRQDRAHRRLGCDRRAVRRYAPQCAGHARAGLFAARAPDTGNHTRVATLAEGLAQADLVSLHTPLRDETRNLMDAAAFATLKRGAILINVARAGLVDEAALLASIRDGRLGGAGLDVYSHEAPFGPLAGFDNVVFTPHLGGTTEDALRRTAEAAAAHVVTALSGRMPETTLNPEAWRGASA
jgi:D-3-phosphoglycerate dehydrogenase